MPRAAPTGEPRAAPAEAPRAAPAGEPAIAPAAASAVAGAPRDALAGLSARPPPAPTAFDRVGYAARVRRAIEGHRRYPAAARRRRWEGVAVVSVDIAATGAIVGQPRLVRSSGRAVLDREALRMARAAAPFSPHAARQALSVHVPVQFTLR